MRDDFVEPKAGNQLASVLQCAVGMGVGPTRFFKWSPLYAAKRLTRAFAVAATLLMIFVVADSNVVKAASADPLAAFQDVANATNETPSPPPKQPPIPSGAPQREVEPGTITQGWSNDSPVSLVADRSEPRLIETGSQLIYETSYGNFFLSNDSPYFVGVSSREDIHGENEVANSAFLVMYKGAILQPTKGTIDASSPNNLTFHYEVYAENESVGIVRVSYTFSTDRTKISASFKNSIGIPETFRIVWLTFTTFDVVDTWYASGVEQRFEDLPLEPYWGRPLFGTMHAIGWLDQTAVKPSKGANGLRLEMTDVPLDSLGVTYAGQLSFGKYSGNAVLTTFSPAKLSIDPQLVLSNVPWDATAFSSIQRKTLYDGERYWIFWKEGTNTIKYAWSIDGKTWNFAGSPVVTTSGSLTYNFAVANYGKTVGVIWVDSNTPKNINARTGLLAVDSILWDSALTILYTGDYNIGKPPVIAFTSQGNQFGIVWVETTNEVGFKRFTCTGQGTSGFSPCANWSAAPRDLVSWAVLDSYYVTLAAFSDGSGSLIRFIVQNSGTYTKSFFHVKLFRSDGSSCFDDAEFGHVDVRNGDSWINDGLFSTAPSGNEVRLFIVDTSTNRILDYAFGSNCGTGQDTTITSQVGGLKYLSAGAAQDGSIFLFYVEGSPGGIQLARIVPYTVLTTETPTTLLTYSAPCLVTIAEHFSHFTPMLFTRHSSGSSCGSPGTYYLYYVNYPLPLDGEAAVNNPWAAKLGTPFVTDTGGVVSPTTGLLSTGQVLVGGTPSVGLIYREPGLFYRTQSGNDEALLGPDAHPIIPGIYYDLPWISATTLHMQGGQTFPLSLTGMSGDLRWFNNSRGMRYTLKNNATTQQYTLTLPSGAYMIFNAVTGSSSEWDLAKVYTDTNGLNSVTYNLDFGITGSIVDGSGRAITLNPTGRPDSIVYGNGQNIGLTDLGVPIGCPGGTASDSGTLQVTDAIGRLTKYYVCHWRLEKVESPNGGRVNYTFATYNANPGRSNQVWQGTEVYSLPLLQMDIYNESGANLKARSLVFNWNFQNGEVVRALVNVTDKSGVVQGSNEYIFNSAMGTASVRTYDSAGQVAYYDMQTLNGASMKDLSGNANDGSIVGTLTDIPGKYGRAREAAGVGNYVDILTPVGLPPRTLTVSSWVKLNAPVNWINIANHNWLNAAGTWVMAVGSASMVLFGFTPDGSTQDTVSSAALSSGYHSLIGTVDGTTGTVAIYVDGVQSATHTYSPVTLATSGFLTFMDQSASGGNIDLDEARVYNRLLSSEDIGVLYAKNSLKRAEQQNWYSINDQPHVSEGFVGDQTTASVVTQDAIDDWGNQIYHRDALGNETFASYANTNHQNHFYAPGRLAKMAGPIFNTEFFDFGSGVFPPGGAWTVATTFNPPPRLDYGNFDKVAPSLVMGVPSSGTTNLTHILTASSPTFLEFRARLNVLGRFEIRLGTSTSYNVGVRFTTSGTIEAYDRGTNAWHTCTLPSLGPATYATFSWYRISIIFTWPYKTYLNGIDLSCGSPTNLGGQTQISFEAFGPGYVWSAWLDDIKIYHNDCNDPHCQSDAVLDIGFDGLQSRQSIALVGEDGSVVDQTMQPGAGTVWLSFNSALTGPYKNYENGDNTKTMVRIYAEDGTLEYQSPLTRFFVGERYAYTRPRALADELVRTTSGALRWPNTIYADEKNAGTCFDVPGKIVACSGSWSWQQSPTVRGALRGNYVHLTPFDYGSRTHYFTFDIGDPIPDYFISYVRIPEGKSPDGIQLMVYFRDDLCTPSPCWNEVYWGVPGDYLNVPPYPFKKSYMGPVPAVRNQWIQLIVSRSDFGILPSGTYWWGVGYGLSGGEAEWDVTTTTSDAQSKLLVYGLTSLGSGLTVGVYDSTNNALVTTGTQTGDFATVNLYKPLSLYSWDAFPIQGNIKIYDGSNEYYFGPLKNLWPQDIFTYAGQSAFFDPKSSGATYWPSPSVHTAQIGAKKFSGDCLDAVLCYDMESSTEGPPSSDGFGSASARMIDLSGRNNFGRVWGTDIYIPYLSPPTSAAAGLGTVFGGASRTSYVSAVDSSTLKFGTGDFTLSAWFRATTLPATGAAYEILGKRVANAGNYEIQLSNAGGTTKVVAFVGDSSGNVPVTSNATISATTLYHVAFRRLSGTVSLWLNGAIAASTVTGTKNTDSTSNLDVGRDPSSAAEYFDGTIDQVVLYNKALSPIEILSRYHSRIPGAPQIYLQPQTNGLVQRSRVPYEGTYLYALATYDSRGNVLTVSDVGRGTNGGANTTTYTYGGIVYGDYLTKVTRPDLREIYYAYDFQMGTKLGTLDIDCRRSRTQYDAMERPIQTSVYDSDLSEVLHIDMESYADQSNHLKDVSCAGTTDSRNGQTIIPSGTTEVAGVDGVARNFALTSDYLDGGDASTTRPASVTVSAWVRTSSSANQWAVSKWKSGSAPNSHYLLTAHYTGITPNRPSFHISNGVSSDYIATVSATINDGRWHFLAGTYDGTTISIYVDGRLDNSKPTTIGALQTAAKGTAIVVGQESSKTGLAPFVGSIDDVRVFNVARSASDVSSLWRFSYKLLSRSSLAYDDMISNVGWTANPTWPGYQFADITSYDPTSVPRALFFDMQTMRFSGISGIADTVEDLSGNGNHATFQGTGGLPVSVAGQVGKALKFTASLQEHLDISYKNNKLNLSGPLTIAAWVNPSGVNVTNPIFTKGYASSLQYYTDIHKSGPKWYFGIEVKNSAGQFVWVNSTTALSTGVWTHVAFTYDGYNVKLYVNGVADASTGTIRWPLATTTYDALIGAYATFPTPYFDGSIDEVHVLATAMSSTEIAALYAGTEKSHVSKTYQDGLGRTVRNVVMDLFGTKIVSVATLGWNDKPVYAYIPSGGYFTYTYDFLGRTVTTQTPGDSTISGLSRSVFSEKASLIESVDGAGRKAYVKTDLLGRTIETAVWNPQIGAYGNLTKVTYNSLSKVITSQDAKSQTTTTYYNSFGKPKITVFPDGTYALVYYDDNLRAFESVDSMGRASISTYDSLGRVTAVTLKPSLSTSCSGNPNPCVVTYVYDPVHDDLLTVDNTTAKITRTYDGLHRIKTEKLDVPSSNPTFTGTITYSFDNASRITDIQYPAGLNSLHAVYTYDSLGRTQQLDYGGSKYAVLTYDSVGRLDNIRYWKGSTDTLIVEKYNYDARDRITQIKVSKSGTTTTYMRLYYGYNRASEIANSTDDMYANGGASNAKAITYSYDGNGRLAQAIGPFSAALDGLGDHAQEYECYDYDQVGNLGHWKSGSSSCSTVYTYNVTGWNRLDSFSFNTMGFAYSGAGSLLTKVESGVTTTYTHDFLQQLTKVVSGASTYTYSYDGLGRRVKMVDPSATSYFMYSGSKMLYSKVGVTETAYIYLGDRLLVRKEGTGTTPEARYYHQDLSTNVRLISFYKDSNPQRGVNVDAKYRYKPFGDIITLTTPPADPRFKFAHGELDSALRLYHMGMRYYDPVVARWIERDPIGPGYHYAVNNPISFIDPTGAVAWLGGRLTDFQGTLNQLHDFFTYTRTGRTTLFLLTAIVAIALVPVGVGWILLAGLVTGAIFVAYTAVASGGRATFDDYYAAFTLGFVVGTTIASVYQSFRLAGEAALARAGPAARAGAEARAASAAETRLSGGLAADERLAMDAPDVVSRAAQTAKTPLAEDVRYMDPKAIRFSQEYVSPRFGGRVAGRLGPEDLAEALRTGAVRPQDVEPIRVFRDLNGEWWTLDNRRLLAFQIAEERVPTVVVSANDPIIAVEIASKFQPIEQGLAVHIVDAQDPVASYLWWNPLVA